MDIKQLLKHYGKATKCIRDPQKPVPSAEEINDVLEAIGLERIAINNIPGPMGHTGTALLDVMYYMILHLAKRIDQLEAGNNSKLPKNVEYDA